MRGIRPNQDALQNAMLWHSTAYGASHLFAAKPVSVAADRYKIRIPNDGGIKIGTRNLVWDCGNDLNLRDLSLADAANWDTQAVVDYTVAANRAGANLYGYWCDPGFGSAPIWKFSAASTFPSGYNANTSRKMVGFHGLCVAVAHQTTLNAWQADTVIALGCTRKATVWDGYIYRCSARTGTFKTHATTEPNWASIAVGDTIVDNEITWTKQLHALEGYVAGDVLPYSVWDWIKRRPVATPEGMVLEPITMVAVDIYLPSGTGTGTVSAYGGTISHSRTALQMRDDFRSVNKYLISRAEFVRAAKSSNWTIINGGLDPATAGGASDAYGRRMISDIGCEEMCGSHWQFSDDVSSTAPNLYALGGFSGSASPGPNAVTANAETAAGSISYSARGVSKLKSHGDF